MGNQEQWPVQQTLAGRSPSFSKILRQSLGVNCTKTTTTVCNVDRRSVLPLLHTVRSYHHQPGNVQIEGSMEHTVSKAGRKVLTQEVEECLRSHPAVQEVHIGDWMIPRFVVKVMRFPRKPCGQVEKYVMRKVMVDNVLACGIGPCLKDFCDPCPGNCGINNCSQKQICESLQKYW